MAYLNCGRCRLEIKIQAAFLRLENCPRCLARAAIVSPLVVSRSPLVPAAGWGSPLSLMPPVTDAGGSSAAEPAG
jgi:hypothetical protein